MKLNIGTPVEMYKVKGVPVYVKREDLCTPEPGPPFSKVRGLYAHMEKLKSQGVRTVGYAESAISMAGWGVAWVAKQLGMKAIIFDPQYKNTTPELLITHRQKWDELGAERIPVPAGRTKVNYYIGTRILQERVPKNSIMLPIGLRLRETVTETAAEWERTCEHMGGYCPRTVVVCVGSGTIAAGLLIGSFDASISICGIMAYGKFPEAKKDQIYLKAGLHFGGLSVLRQKNDIEVHGSEFSYTEASYAPCPFPTNDFYDLKAWEWLTRHVSKLKHPILFWNIGSKAK